MPISLDDSKINYDSPEYEEMLNDLQGNILKGHGRDYNVSIVLRFKTNQKTKAAEFIRTLAENTITSTKRQLQQIADYRSRRIRGQLFANLCLSYKGYQFFGYSQDQIPADPRFRAGMKQVGQILNDPDPSQWEAPYQNDSHAIVLLANDSELTLQGQARQILQRVKENDIADILTVEYGVALKNEADEPIEHFGYVDGISQPLFFKQDIDRTKRDSGLNEYDDFSRFDSTASLGLVLVRDPNGRSADSFGSYMVFRKLEQNVRGFKEELERLADALGLKGETARDRAGAMVIGRFEDGTPLITQELDGGTYSNDFNYAGENGAKCPFHAHIRKTNPRGETVVQDFRYDEAALYQEERAHRIVRRGITYGKRNVEPYENPLPEECPTAGVGVLFMCFQSDIAKQFEFIQIQMSNNSEFPRPSTGIDPLIGQGQASSSQSWPQEWGKPESIQFDFTRCVTLKGGEYFFMPSISFLKTISTATPQEPVY
ncbi:MAG: Dyp-type peroxidase [Nitrospira sp. CR1.3]|nr:Dyp-type peroxidase [Nitrospira sp. CR1.3]